jgi:hypothetical protein
VHPHAHIFSGDVTMLWLKILHLLVVTCNAFVFGILFSRFSSGKWRGAVDTITLIGWSVMFVAFTFIIISQDF